MGRPLQAACTAQEPIPPSARNISGWKRAGSAWRAATSSRKAQSVRNIRAARPKAGSSQQPCPADRAWCHRKMHRCGKPLNRAQEFRGNAGACVEQAARTKSALFKEHFSRLPSIGCRWPMSTKRRTQTTLRRRPGDDCLLRDYPGRRLLIRRTARRLGPVPAESASPACAPSGALQDPRRSGLTVARPMTPPGSRTRR